MSRVLNASQQAILEGNPYFVERLLEIQTPDVSYYYTSGSVDVAVDTGTSGGSQTFLANNGVEVIGDISEIYELSINELIIQIGDVGDVIFDNMVRASTSYDFARTNVQIYLLFRHPQTYAAYASETMNIFKGGISKIDITRSETDSVINLRIASKFARFDNVNGRNTSDYAQGLITTGLVWGNING